MATVKISIVKARTTALTGGLLQIADSQPRAAETITSSGTSQQSTITANGGEVLCVTASGGAVHVAFGTNPTASASAGYLIPDGGTLFVGALENTEKCAVVNA